MKPTTPDLEPVFEVEVKLDPPLDMGVTSAGERRIINIIGGTIKNGLNATILPGGADWQRVRDDGSLEISGRYTARTEEGEILDMVVDGIRTGSKKVLESLQRGEQVNPDDYYFRTVLKIQTSAPRLAWLQRSIFIASCIREANSVSYTCYKLT